MLEGSLRRVRWVAASALLTVGTLAVAAGTAQAASPKDIGAVAFQKNNNRAQTAAQTDYGLAQQSEAEHGRVIVSWRGVDNTLRSGVPDYRAGLDSKECTTPRYDWCQLDRLLRGYRFIRLPVNPVLIGTPEWANARSCRVGRGANACHPATLAMGEWRDFVTAAVRRYGPNGTYWNGLRAGTIFDMQVWEVWNEPDLHMFWDGSRQDSAAADAREYAQLLDATASAVHAASSKAHAARVAGPGISSFNPSRPGEWLRSFARQGARSRLDVVSGHLYGGSAWEVVGQVNRYRRMLPKRPMWITENGFGSGSGCQHCVGGTRAQRNQFRLLMNLLGNRSYVKSFTWFMGARHPAFQGTHGLYRDNGRSKPIVKVFKARAAQ